MSNKAMRGWVIGIPALILVLICIIVWNEPKGDGVSRAMAGRAVTLALCSDEELDKWKKEGHISSFDRRAQEQWYVPYMDYLYYNAYMDVAAIPATEDSMLQAITYGELESLLDSVSDSLGKTVRVSGKNRNTPYPRDQFSSLYEAVLKELDPDGAVQKQSLLLYGTPLNVENSAPWTAYTNLGDLRFDGLALDAYIDCEIEVYVCGHELIWMDRMVSDHVVYKNAWIMEGTEDNLLVFLGSIKREMPYGNKSGRDKVYNQVVDLSLKAGKMEKITVKKDRVRAKVLLVKDSYLELEGYGVLELDEGFRVLKTYGQFEEQTMADILVGYELQEFVVAEGKICAALTVREFDAERIRVLLHQSQFKGTLHPSVQLVCQDPMTMMMGAETRTVPAGEVLEFTPESAEMAQGRVILRADGSSGIQILSIDRAMKEKPVYDGQIEVAPAEGGLVIINDIYLEEYLKKVVPSEMPKDFEKEALKAQAVCARTYAYMQIRGNKFQEYGAHVDDSINYQVYNNIETHTRTDAAVQETYGELLTYEGKPFEAFYFSTSCGTTADGSVWGGDSSRYPYLKSVGLQSKRETLELTNNKTFASFIKNYDYPSYDSEFPMYRWSTSVSSTTLEKNIKGIGTIEAVNVVERGTGGVVQVLEVIGSKGTETITGQDKVRRILKDPDAESMELKNRLGNILEWKDNVPSAFITIESGGKDDNGVTMFYIYGGGYGHGAGMSQNGAEGMARQGKDYLEILKFFYEGVEVGQL